MIIWNNYEYGKKVYEEKSVRTKKWQYKELRTLVLYMVLNGKQPKEIREVLEECCQDDIKYLRENQKKTIFNKIITQTKQELPKKDEIIKEKYIKSKEITIFVDEINQIKALCDQNLEKVAFVLLVYCKWLDNLTWFTMSKADISKEAKTRNLNSADQQRILTRLVASQYIKSDVRKAKRKHCRSFGGNEQQMWSLTYLSQEGDVAFTISDYENFVYRYLDYVYGGYFICPVCGKIFKQNKQNNLVYCNKCSKKVKSERDKKKYDHIERKTIFCVDCGEEIEINSKDNQTDRCPECYKKYRKKYWAENKRRLRSR